MRKSFNYMVLFFLFVFFFSGCAQLRTEFYRDETKHLYETGCQFYKQGEYEDAQTAFEKTVSLDPDYGPAHAALGNLAMIREEYENAYNHYQRAMNQDPELKKELLPFLMISNMYKALEPLRKSGIDLATIYPLFMQDKHEDLQLLLTKDIPLELLARDTISLTPGQLAELRRKAAESALNLPASISYRLFISYLLFYSEKFDETTSELLSSIIESADSTQLQEAYVLFGRLHERMGDNSKAIDAYLAAVKAGKSIEDIAHYLARIYQVDIATVLPVRQKQPAEPHREKETNKVVSGPSIVSKPEALPAKTSAGFSKTIPKPQAILISNPE